MIYRVEHKKPKEGYQEVYQGAVRGYAWKLYFQIKGTLKPEEKVRIMERNPKIDQDFRKLAGHTCYYT